MVRWLAMVGLGAVLQSSRGSSEDWNVQSSLKAQVVEVKERRGRSLIQVVNEAQNHVWECEKGT